MVGALVTTMEMKIDYSGIGGGITVLDFVWLHMIMILNNITVVWSAALVSDYSLHF